MQMEQIDMTFEEQLVFYMEKALANPPSRGRNGRIYSHSGASITHDLRNGFPATLGKRLMWKTVVAELIWFIRGSTSVHELSEILHKDKRKTNIWTDNQQEAALSRPELFRNGHAGPIYGKQWRDWNGIDQLRQVIYNIIMDPYSRRHLISAWNVSEIDQMCLPPCHFAFQFIAGPDGLLNLVWYQRSCDSFLGFPFNIASYALLLVLVCEIVRMTPGTVTGHIGDFHCYEEHEEVIKTYMDRVANNTQQYPDILLQKKVASIKGMEKLTVEDVELIGYKPESPLKARMVP